MEVLKSIEDFLESRELNRKYRCSYSCLTYLSISHIYIPFQEATFFTQTASNKHRVTRPTRDRGIAAGEAALRGVTAGQRARNAEVGRHQPYDVSMSYANDAYVTTAEPMGADTNLES